MQSFTLRYPARPWTLNVERQGNPYRRARLVKEWREAFALLAAEQKIPPLAFISVAVASPELRNRSGIPDTGACIGAVKAGVDGLVDAGLLPDDGPEYVHRLVFEAPVVTGVDALQLTIYAEVA